CSSKPKTSRRRSRFWRTRATRLRPNVRLERVRDGEGTVFLLIVFHDRDERAPHRESRAVQRVHEMNFPLLVSVADIRPARLKVPEVAAARNLHESVRSRRPNF